LPGIGKTIEEKLRALFETGVIPSAEKLKAKYPPGLVEVTRLPGFGAKKARKLFDALGVQSLDDLKRAVDQEQLRDVPGFGPKAEENVRAALEAGVQARSRLLLSKTFEVADSLISAIREHPAADRVEIAGSARRWAESCKDLDIVATAGDANALSKAFAELPLLGEIQHQGTAGVKAVTHNGLPIDLRIVPPENFGNLLQHFTGSGKHNEALRTAAVKRGYNVSEYGVTFDGTSHACATEEEVYELLGMQFIPPELRENRGEIQAALNGELPELLTLEDIRGDLHMHTVASDGRFTIEQMAEACKERGYEYLAITDHSATHGFGNDVSADELRRQIERVHEADAAIDGIRILAGTEVNVLPDGSLDYDDALLAQLDWIVASLHSSFRIGEKEQTERMIRAMEHPLVDLIGHPTGRLIERREPYALDIDAIAEAAVRTGTFLEINANPDRRDLNELNARRVVAAGATIVIDSDAHWTRTLANMKYGVATARRAWLTAENVANTRSWPELDAMRKSSARPSERARSS
jgi:DNA polymerase (family 10)